MPTDSEKGKRVEEVDPESALGGWWKPAVAVFGEVTGWIVVPVVGALYLGRYLDEKQGTSNLYFFSLTALAFIISCTGIGIMGVKYIKQLNADQKKEKKKKRDGRSQ